MQEGKKMIPIGHKVKNFICINKTEQKMWFYVPTLQKALS